VLKWSALEIFEVLDKQIMIIAHNDSRLSWHGHISLEQTEDYTRPWRIPFEKRGLFAGDLANRAATQAGVRLSFHSNTSQVRGSILPYEAPQNIDLYIDGEHHGTSDFAGNTSFAFEGLPEGDHLLELWLPQRGDFALQALELDDDASLAPYTDTRSRWVTYGSSITHCGDAASPSFTWPGVVARARNLNLTCLGYGGQCHLDPLMACVIRDRAADYISIKAGINIYGSGSLNSRTFGPNLIGFVQIVREKHPTTPIALASPIYSFDRETTPNSTGWTLQNYRDAVRDAVQTLQENGDQNIVYVDGLELYNADLGHLMPDNLHPNADGYKALGRNFLLHGAPKLFG
jgi:lysophospholipase L1-like esterase